jgi:hypothetical protein
MKIKNRWLLGITALILAVGVSIAVYFSQQKQQPKSNASASTSMSFAPSTSPSAPFQKQIGDTTSFDVTLNPGNNQVSFVRLEIDYDPAKVQPTANPFTVNTSAFPVTTEGPIVQNGKVLISVTVGADPSKAVNQITKVGNFNFKVVSQTPASTPTILTFGSATQVLSVAPGDQASENVLSTTSPAYIAINAVPTPTLIPPTPTLVPPTPTPTKVPPTPTPTVLPNNTILNMSVFMHGIGSSGDNANPNNATLSNKNPLHPTRAVTVQIYDLNNQLRATGNGNVIFDSATGNFKGTLSLGQSIIASGSYSIKVQSPTHLRRLVGGGIQNLTIGQTNIIEAVSLTAGDVNSDNKIDILDYNTMIGCYSDLSPAISCTSGNKLLSDLNDDGAVNQVDYNLFLREISVQNGQ